MHGSFRTGTLASLLALVPAYAQPQTGTPDDARLIADGLSIETMFDDTAIRGEGGARIGRVENVIFHEDGRALSIIAEVDPAGGGEEIHLNVPWDRIGLGDSPAAIDVPMTGDAIAEYSIFGDYVEGEQVVGEIGAQTPGEVSGDIATGPATFRATDLIGDTAVLADGTRYGHVADLVVLEGALAAVLVEASASGRPGHFAFPFSAEAAADPAAPDYRLSLSPEQAEALAPFDRTRLEP